MDFLTVRSETKENVISSFKKIADELLGNYILQVNSNYYRLIDIEFYYNTDNKADEKNNIHRDVYTHNHKTQLYLGKWYFHSSGIDITIGNGSDHYGGILIRGLAKLRNSNSGVTDIVDQIHGPVKVKSEICGNFKSVLDGSPNVFYLLKANEPEGIHMDKPLYVVMTKRINLNSQKDVGKEKYWDSKYRYVILLDKYQFKYADKTVIAKDLKNQYDLTNDKVNQLLGSKFI